MKQQRRNEDGLVAIIVASIIMVILSLITLGFARLMQREQRESLDRSLSTQAFYAAESAVNDAVQKIQAGTFTGEKSDCAAGSTPFTGKIDESRGVGYSCLIIDPSPPSLEYSSISTTDFKTIPIESETGVPISQVKIAWDDPKLPDNDLTNRPLTTPVFSNCTPAELAILPSVSSWSQLSPGILQVDLVPTDPPLSRQSLIDETLHLYLYPCAAGVNSINYGDHNDAIEKGKIIPVRCTRDGSPRDCEVSINMNDAEANRQYYVRMRSIYRATGVSIRVFDKDAAQLALVKSQTLIDATGKVADVLRRVQVRLPDMKSYATPDFVISTTNAICKQVQYTPTNVTDSCTY